MQITGNTQPISAVDGVDFEIFPGETLGVVGESGCGKSMTALALTGLLPKPQVRVTSGQVLFEGQDLLKCSESRLRTLRGNRIGMIFQEPMTSLNPLLSIGVQISEALVIHHRLSQSAAASAAVELLARVGIGSPESRARDYPHRLSGGMRQRVMIAMAMACRPSLLIADEPTTALDVTIQSQILELIDELKRETNAAVLLITHNLGVVAQTAQRVMVMYSGKIVEQASVEQLFSNPTHPYTRGLIGSIPVLGRRTRESRVRLQEIPGTVDPANAGRPGCRFAPRCASRQTECSLTAPPSRRHRNHLVACHVHHPGAA